jgi:hypothetical protein
MSVSGMRGTATTKKGNEVYLREMLRLVYVREKCRERRVQNKESRRKSVSMKGIRKGEKKVRKGRSGEV